MMKVNIIFTAILFWLFACSNSYPPNTEETQQASDLLQSSTQVTQSETPNIPTARPTYTNTATITQTPISTETQSNPLLAGLTYWKDFDYWQINDEGEHIFLQRTRDYFSPSGRYIATTSCGQGCTDILLTDLSTGKQINLTNTPEKSSDNPVWSPDNKMIYYLEWDENVSDIWSVDIATLKKTRLTQTADRIESLLFRMTAYPDLLFFFSWTTDISIGEGWVGSLTSMKLDGSEYQVLPHDLSQYPAFSPDNKTIGLMSYNYDDEGNYFRQTWLYRPGSEPQPFPLNKFHFGDLSEVEIYSQLSWSPDQSKIAVWVSAQRKDGDFSGIVILDLRNFTTQVIGEYRSPYTGGSGAPKVEWSPDSQWIDFYASDSNEEKDFGIWLANQSGEGVQNIHKTGDSADYCDEVWSPDGQWLLYSCEHYKKGNGSWLVNLDTMEQTATALPAEIRLTGWSTIAIFEINSYLQITETGAHLNLREAPGFDAPVLLQLQSEELVQILEGPVHTENFIWWLVQTEEGVRGWVVEQQGWYTSVEIPE